MAKIQVLGDAVVLTSAMTLEDLRTIAKYRPDALILKGGEDGKEPIFRLFVDGIQEAFAKNGVVFNSESRDGKKLAQITQLVCGKVDDLEEFIADEYGAGLTKLNELEEILPDVLEAVKAERAAIKQSIEIITDEPVCDCDQPGTTEE